MFRDLRRKRQALSPQACADVLARGTSGVLAVAGDGGYPYAVPLSFLYDGGKLYFHCARAGHKLDAIRRDPRASFCVIDQDQVVPAEYTSYFRSVIAFGQVRVLDSEEEMRQAVEKLALKYAPEDSPSNRQSAIQREWDSLWRLEMTVEHLSGKEAVELVPGTRRMALMNCLLHSLPGRGEGVVHLGNSLGAAGAALSPADVILTNPPFGTARGSGITRSDLPFKTSNKQLAFLEHIYRGLKPGGRAAVVFPDNVLFEDGAGRQIRIDLMDRCTLHTILRLPTGIFYAAGVQANVLFFTRGTKDNPLQDEGCTTGVWVYDLRTNMPSFGKTSPFTSEYLKPFAQVFGTDPYGQSVRTEGEWSFTQGEHTAENNRWRYFSRKWIKEHNDESLNISWVKDQDLAQDLAGVDLNELIGQAQTEAGEIVKLLEALKSAAAAQQGSPA